MPEDEKDRKVDNREDKIWSREILHQLCLMLSRCIKKCSVSYVICRGEISQGQERAKSDNVGEGNMGFLRHSSLRTDDYSQGEESSPQKLQSQLH